MVSVFNLIFPSYFSLLSFSEKYFKNGTRSHHLLFKKLDTCLRSTQLLDYIEQSGLVKELVKSSIKLLNFMLWHFPPEQRTSYPSQHCWDFEVRLERFEDIVRGNIGSMPLWEDGKELDALFTTRRWKNIRKKKSEAHIQVSCLPDVFLAGFTKCGSTFLFELLTSHRYVVKPFHKETRFWTHLPHDSDTLNLRLADYLLELNPHLQTAADSLYQPFIPKSLLIVDGSPDLLFHRPFMENKEQSFQLISSYCTLPSVIPLLMPRAKFVVVMRNPIDMLYSAFWHSCTHRNQTLTREQQLRGVNVFHNRLVMKINTFRTCLENFPFHYCVINATTFTDTLQPTNDFPNCGKIHLGTAMYHVHIEKWLTVIPRESFLFLAMEELSTYTNVVATKLWYFLHVHRSTNFWSEPLNKQQKVDYHSDPALMMRTDTQELLEKFFQPFNTRLADLLKDTTFMWS